MESEFRTVYSAQASADQDYGENRSRTRVSPTIATAMTEDEARTQGMRKALEKWPIKDGWYNHTVEVTSLQQKKMFGQYFDWYLLDDN